MLRASSLPLVSARTSRAASTPAGPPVRRVATATASARAPGNGGYIDSFEHRLADDEDAAVGVGVGGLARGISLVRSFLQELAADRPRPRVAARDLGRRGVEQLPTAVPAVPLSSSITISVVPPRKGSISTGTSRSNRACGRSARRELASFDALATSSLHQRRLRLLGAHLGARALGVERVGDRRCAADGRAGRGADEIVGGAAVARIERSAQRARARLDEADDLELVRRRRRLHLERAPGIARAVEVELDQDQPADLRPAAVVQLLVRLPRALRDHLRRAAGADARCRRCRSASPRARTRPARSRFRRAAARTRSPPGGRSRRDRRREACLPRRGRRRRPRAGAPSPARSPGPS